MARTASRLVAHHQQQRREATVAAVGSVSCRRPNAEVDVVSEYEHLGDRAARGRLRSPIVSGIPRRRSVGCTEFIPPGTTRAVITARRHAPYRSRVSAPPARPSRHVGGALRPLGPPDIAITEGDRRSRPSQRSTCRISGCLTRTVRLSISIARASFSAECGRVGRRH
jgi:hypothetical protein